MPVLIDGYNLLFALGWIRGRRGGPAALEKARRHLLGLLSGVYGPEAGTVTVVFDAANAPAGVADYEIYQGVHVRYARRREQADDLIEEAIRRDSAPRRLTIVSDDRRLQKAARRRQCVALSCADYVDELERRRGARGRRRTDRPPKPEAVSPEESRHWLREFGDLAQDPQFKEVFGPWEFLAGEDETP
jgi:predicted RNA-binding protein with PIN domain